MNRTILLALLLTASAAQAHSGHDGAHAQEGSAFLLGLAHPLGGLDHLIAMIAVGVWAAMVGGRAIWALPAAFVAAMVIGGALGSAGAVFWDVEPVILASVIVLGAAVMLSVKPAFAVSVGVVALFGFAHGAAHGLEGPATGVLAYGAGFVLATIGLHLVGIAGGRALERRGGLVGARLLGGAATAAGLVLLIL
jgi:urease accessory protein